jgi:hypothetical protein
LSTALYKIYGTNQHLKFSSAKSQSHSCSS